MGCGPVQLPRLPSCAAFLHAQGAGGAGRPGYLLPVSTDKLNSRGPEYLRFLVWINGYLQVCACCCRNAAPNFSYNEILYLGGTGAIPRAAPACLS